jgi:Ferritin-like domain
METLDPTLSQLSRGQFITGGMKGGLALVAGGTILAAATGTAFGATAGDVAIAKLAATAELLAMDFYAQAIKSGQLKGDQLAYLQAARANEVDHYNALKGVLGAATPKGVKFKYPAGTFATKKSIAATGSALETAFVGAYMGAVTALKDNGLKGVAAQIGANEAQHLTIFNQIGAGSLVANPSFPKVLTAAQATKAVTPFLA